MDRYQPNILARRLLEPIIGRGLIFAEGDEWRRQHRQLVPFFRPRSIERLIPSIHHIAAAHIDSWPVEASQTRNLLGDFRALTIAVIAGSLLSIDDSRRTAQLAAFASETEALGALIEWRDYLALFLRTHVAQPRERRSFAQRWRAWIEEIVDSRTESGNAAAWDMIELLRRGTDVENGVPREEIVDQVGTMLSSGFITTALALFWTVLLLALRPSDQESVRYELCCSPANEPPSWAALRASLTTTGFLYESLRLFPPVYMIAREAREDDRIDDLQIPRGATVIVSPWIAHRHAAHWRDPVRFDPSRFRQGEEIATPRAWMPFGVGPRVCVASVFATTEILIVLRCLLSRYRIELNGPAPEPVGRVTLTPAFQPLFTLTRIGAA